MQASALLSNISVLSLGFKENYSHIFRHQWVLDYIARKNLNDSHVIVFMDGGDSFFTSGDTMQRAVTKFIDSTAATTDEFDPKAVMEGKATAPFLFGAEEDCWGGDLWYLGRRSIALCRAQYARAYKNASRALGSGSEDTVGWGGVKYPYLNAGVLISRVWAFRKAATAFYARLATRKNFRCDQAVWTSIFLECMIENSCGTDKKSVPQGLISLDFRNSFSLFPYGIFFFTKRYRRWMRSAIDKYMASRIPPFPHFFDLADNPNATPGVVHFPGWRRSFLCVVPRILETTAWVREPHRDAHSIVRSTEYLRNTATVKAYRANGEEKLLKYGDVCSADDVMTVSWLGRRRKLDKSF